MGKGKWKLEKEKNPEEKGEEYTLADKCEDEYKAHGGILKEVGREITGQKGLRGNTKHWIEELARNLRCVGIRLKEIQHVIGVKGGTKLNSQGIAIWAEKDLERYRKRL